MSKPTSNTKKTLKEIKTIQKEVKTRGERIHAIWRRHKKILKEYNRLVPIKQPVVELIRQNGKVEQYHNVKGTLFEYEHTNGGTYHQPLLPNTLLECEIGGQTYKKWILHEDSFFPINSTVIFGVEYLTALVEKIHFDSKAWRGIDKNKSVGNLVWTIALSIGVVILALLLFKYAPGILSKLGLYDMAKNAVTSLPPLQP